MFERGREPKENRIAWSRVVNPCKQIGLSDAPQFEDAAAVRRRAEIDRHPDVSIGVEVVYAYHSHSTFLR